MGGDPMHVPVVLVHGWPVTSAHWRHLAPALTREGFSTTAVTLPGLGSASHGDMSFDKLALGHWLLNELDARGMSRFALIGHDWGATVAVLAAARAPSAVAALVVEEEILPGVDVDVPSPGAGHYPTWHGPFNRAPGLAEQLVPGREPAYYGTFLEQSAGPTGLDPEAVRSYVEAYTGPEKLSAGLAYYRTRERDVADVQGLIAEPIHTPVLAVGGRFALGAAVAAGMRAVADDVTGAVLNASGHYPAEQEPDAVASAIGPFLRGRSRE